MQSQFHIEWTDKVDQAEKIVETIVQISKCSSNSNSSDSTSGKLFSITLYHTTCKCMIQGNKKDMWIKDEYPILKKTLDHHKTEGMPIVEAYKSILESKSSQSSDIFVVQEIIDELVAKTVLISEGVQSSSTTQESVLEQLQCCPENVSNKEILYLLKTPSKKNCKSSKAQKTPHENDPAIENLKSTVNKLDMDILDLNEKFLLEKHLLQEYVQAYIKDLLTPIIEENGILKQKIKNCQEEILKLKCTRENDVRQMKENVGKCLEAAETAKFDNAQQYRKVIQEIAKRTLRNSKMSMTVS